MIFKRMIGWQSVGHIPFMSDVALHFQSFDIRNHRIPYQKLCKFSGRPFIVITPPSKMYPSGPPGGVVAARVVGY